MTISLQVNIPAKQSHSYPIVIAAQLLSQWQDWLPACAPSRKIVIISDDIVAKLYGVQLADELSLAGYQVKLIEFDHGENSKSALTKLAIEEQMFAFGCDRKSLCLALGGGVVGDLAGFVAATYMRGMNFIQVPTSFLAMIDSSVGGKTAVNTSYGKNIIGAFWQPQAVFMDTLVLKTLPRKQIINGFFEAVKIFLTLDAEHFVYCQEHLAAILNLEPVAINTVIQHAVGLKAYVVETDEQERNLRMILNYGHTVAHALEKLSNYTIMHGYAVAIGMLVEAKIAQLSGLLSIHDYDAIAAFLGKLEISPQLLHDFAVEDIIHSMRGDKKNTNQQILLVLLNGIGSVKNIENQVAFPVDESLIHAALTQLINR